jgi:hypothetical protein
VTKPRTNIIAQLLDELTSFWNAFWVIVIAVFCLWFQFRIRAEISEAAAEAAKEVSAPKGAL